MREPEKNRNQNKMGAQKKRVSEDPDELVRVPLQAILLADSFTTKFRPITLERPKVNLPYYNALQSSYIFYLLICFFTFGFEGAAAARECSDDKLHAHLARIRWRRRCFRFLLFSFQAGH